MQDFYSFSSSSFFFFFFFYKLFIPRIIFLHSSGGLAISSSVNP